MEFDMPHLWGGLPLDSGSLAPSQSLAPELLLRADIDGSPIELPMG